MDKSYDNVNTGALFLNTKKNSADSPDLVGEVNVAGREYRVFARNKVSASGKEYLKLKVVAKVD